MPPSRPASPHRGLLLDLDGTVADSHAMLANVYARLIAHAGAGADALTFEEAAAHTLPDVVAGLCATRPDLDPADLLRRYEAWVYEGYVEVPARTGAAQLLDWARERGWRTAIVTSASVEPSRAWLSARGLADLIDATVGRENTERSKPHPDPYRFALEALDCDGVTSVAVEDSRTGARAAVDAGLRTYAIVAPGAERAGWPAVTGFVHELLDLQELLARA